MAMRTCPYCGEKNEVDAKVCVNCGEALPKRKKRKNKKAKKNSPALLIILIILCLLLVAVALYYFLVYRPASVPMNVQNKEITITADGKEYQAQYTGVTLGGVTQGGKFYVQNDDGSTWEFDGTANRNGTITGNVAEMPMHLTIGDQEYLLKFTGQVENGMPQGEGYFDGGTWTFTGSIRDGVMEGQAANLPVPVTVGNQETMLNYTGTISANQLNDAVEVENTQVIIKFQDREYTGEYTGTLKYGVPDGTGTFSSEGSLPFSYTGEWSSGYPYGSGELSGDAVMIYCLGAQREGRFDGTFTNGTAEGEGTFTSKDNDGLEFTYEGNFTGGTFSGQGTLTYTDSSKPQLKGNFDTGKYAPTFQELIATLGTSEEEPFEVSAESMNFISENEEFFKRGSKDKCKDAISKKYDLDEFVKDPSSFAGKLFRIKLRLLSKETNNDFHGFRMTTLICEDNQGNAYHGYYFGSGLSALQEGKKLTICGYPIAVSTKADGTKVVEFLHCFVG